MPLKSKKYEVVKRTKRDIDGVDLGHRKYSFGSVGAFQTTDAGEAAAIRQSIGQEGTKDVLVIEVPNHDERGIMVFGMPRNWEGFKYATRAERDAALAAEREKDKE